MSDEDKMDTISLDQCDVEHQEHDKEFTGLFAQTEAAIRGKLSELTCPLPQVSGDIESKKVQDIAELGKTPQAKQDIIPVSSCTEPGSSILSNSRQGIGSSQSHTPGSESSFDPDYKGESMNQGVASVSGTASTTNPIDSSVVGGAEIETQQSVVHSVSASESPRSTEVAYSARPLASDSHMQDKKMKEENESLSSEKEQMSPSSESVDFKMDSNQSTKDDKGADNQSSTTEISVIKNRVLSVPQSNRQEPPVQNVTVVMATSPVSVMDSISVSQSCDQQLKSDVSCSVGNVSEKIEIDGFENVLQANNSVSESNKVDDSFFTVNIAEDMMKTDTGTVPSCLNGSQISQEESNKKIQVTDTELKIAETIKNENPGKQCNMSDHWSSNEANTTVNLLLGRDVGRKSSGTPPQTSSQNVMCSGTEDGTNLAGHERVTTKVLTDSLGSLEEFVNRTGSAVSASATTLRISDKTILSASKIPVTSNTTSFSDTRLCSIGAEQASNSFSTLENKAAVDVGETHAESSLEEKTFSSKTMETNSSKDSAPAASSDILTSSGSDPDSGEAQDTVTSSTGITTTTTTNTTTTTPAAMSENEDTDSSMPVIANIFSISNMSSIPETIREELTDAQNYGNGDENQALEAPQSKKLKSPLPVGKQESKSSTKVTVKKEIYRQADLLKVDSNQMEVIKLDPKKHVTKATSPTGTQTNLQATPLTSNASHVLVPCNIITSKDGSKKITLNLSGAPEPKKAQKTCNPSVVTLLKSKPMKIDLGLNSINIMSVGEPIITELIARKNPVAVYKPPPIPNSLKSVLNKEPFQCYECGDSFYHKSSLTQHLSRRSMKIKYRCEWCPDHLSLVLFYNKCQLLNHLRNHMNIRKTQAVPIHIKSNSIEISTIMDEITVGKPFEWYTEQAGVSQGTVLKQQEKKVMQIDKSTDHMKVKRIGDDTTQICLECKTTFPNTEARTRHLQGDSPENALPCDKCPMYLGSSCSLKIHQKLHEPGFPNVCPDCGTCFRPKTQQLVFFSHIKYVCLHLSQFVSYKCTKCQHSLTCDAQIRSHLLSSLEQYYKCCKCPMALKTLSTYKIHYNSFHMSASEINPTEAGRYKIIYRCHICDTLIDDKNYLMSHITSHCNVIKLNRTFKYHCIQCGLICDTKPELKHHFKSSHNLNQIKKNCFCNLCRKDFLTYQAYLAHHFKVHRSNSKMEEAVMCDICGLVCASRNLLMIHECHAQKELQKTVSKVPIPKVSESQSLTKKYPPIKPKPQPQPQEVQVDEDLGPLSRVCLSCGFYFRGVNSRIYHIRGHRNGEVFICIHCDKMDFKTYGELRSHEIVCGVKKDQKMPVQTFSKRGKKAKMVLPQPVIESGELNVENTAKSFTCEKCSKVLRSKEALEEHNRVEHGIHPCHLCGLMYKSRISLVKHIKVTHEGKKCVYFCWICRARKISRSFSCPSHLEKHLSIKHKMKSWDKTLIVPEFPGLEGVQETEDQHKRKLEPDDSGPMDPVKKLRVEAGESYNCAKCEYSTMDHDQFVEHIREHKVKNTVQCVECGLCFTVEPSLKKHLFMVHKIRDFDAYFQKNKLDKIQDDPKSEKEGNDDDHVDTSMNVSVSEESDGETVNPLECKVCYRTFETDKLLKSHMRNHGMAFIKKTRRALAASSTKTMSKEEEVALREEENRKLEALMSRNRPRSRSSAPEEKVQNEAGLSKNQTEKTRSEAEKTQSEAEKNQNETALSETELETNKEDQNKAESMAGDMEVDNTDKSGNTSDQQTNSVLSNTTSSSQVETAEDSTAMETD